MIITLGDQGTELGLRPALIFLFKLAGSASPAVKRGSSMGKKGFDIRPFEKLKKKIESRQSASSAQPVRQKKPEEFTDDELFTCAMNDVDKIEAFRRLSSARRRRRNTVIERVRLDPVLSVLGEIADGKRPIHLADTQEYVEWTSQDYHDAITLKLHDGQFSVQDCLDLHGCTVPEAESELNQFVLESCKKGLRCIKIIHGRGLRSVKGPRIKDAVVKRLAGHFRNDIIAFVTARQCDGGLGALYVLLRKK
jgi:DNA-nicking Smr family endonuclease